MTTQKITPCLWFEKNNCEEALNFYTSIFKNSKIISINRYPENIENPPWGPGMNGKIITAIFELEGQKFLALDGGPHFKPSGAISFMVECEDQNEIDYYWDRMTEGGDPNSQQCGWLADKFGFSWQIVPKNMGELLKSPGAMERMLEMKKIDIEKLKGSR